MAKRVRHRLQIARVLQRFRAEHVAQVAERDLAGVADFSTEEGEEVWGKAAASYRHSWLRWVDMTLYLPENGKILAVVAGDLPGSSAALRPDGRDTEFLRTHGMTITTTSGRVEARFYTDSREYLGEYLELCDRPANPQPLSTCKFCEFDFEMSFAK
jgi:hypothetical protein